MWLAMAAVAAWLIGYAVLCTVRPFGPCRRCRATGEILWFHKPRTCPRCRGKKLRLRLGRRAHNSWRSTHEAGTR